MICELLSLLLTVLEEPVEAGPWITTNAPAPPPPPTTMVLSLLLL
jgi:hypothetical protein